MSFDPSQYGGVICTLDELQRSNQPDPTIHCLTRGQSIGLTVNALAAFASFTAVSVTFILIARNYILHVWRPPPGQWQLIHSPMDLYMLSLFMFNLLQALGTVLDVKWLHDGIVQNGSYCTAQGVIQQFGETGVALCTCAIAVHTFIAVLWCRGAHALRAARSVVGLIWLFIILYVGITAGIHRNEDYDTPTPYWCWIGPHYLKEKITGEYLWFWLTLATSIITYSTLFFWSRGNITVGVDKWWKFEIHRAFPEVNREQRRASLFMLVYPLAYSYIIMPVSVVRWIEFVQESKGNNNISSQATLAASTVFELSGIVDVVLFFCTRSGLLLFTRRDPVSETGRAPSPSLPSSRTPSEKGQPRIQSDTTVRDLELNSGEDGRNERSGNLPGDGDDGWDLPQMDDPSPLHRSISAEGSVLSDGCSTSSLSFVSHTR